MDPQAIRQLKQAGIDVTLGGTIPFVMIEVDEAERPRPVGQEVGVQAGPHIVTVQLKQISELFLGNRQPPDLSGEPPAEYVMCSRSCWRAHGARRTAYGQ